MVMTYLRYVAVCVAPNGVGMRGVSVAPESQL